MQRRYGPACRIARQAAALVKHGLRPVLSL